MLVVEIHAGSTGESPPSREQIGTPMLPECDYFVCREQNHPLPLPGLRLLHRARARRWCQTLPGANTCRFAPETSVSSRNCSGLPQTVTFSSGAVINYSYAADGTKLRESRTVSGNIPSTKRIVFGVKVGF